jgi:plastocyanin
VTRQGRRTVRGVCASLAVVVAAGLVVAGCSGDDAGSTYRPPKGPARATLRITAGNFFFRPETVKGPAGIDKVELVGTEGAHTLVIDGVEDFKLRVDGHETDSAKVRFRPGDYTFYCDIPGHRAAGMEGTIRIT